MPYDRFGNQNSSEHLPPSDMNNPVKFENNYESNYENNFETSYESNLDNTYDSNLPVSSNNSAIVNSEPRRASVPERRTAEFDTEKALVEHDKIEFGQVPSIFCNCFTFGNSCLGQVFKTIFS